MKLAGTEESIGGETLDDYAVQKIIGWFRIFLFQDFLQNMQLTVMKEIHDYYCNHAQIFQNRNIIILLCIIMELKVFKEAISCAVLAKYPWMSFIGILTLQ